MLCEHNLDLGKLCKLENDQMGRKFWYVVNGYHILQTRQFSLKTSLWLVNYDIFRCQPQFEQLG